MHTTPPGRSQCNFVQKEGQIRVQRAILAPVLAAKCKVVGLDFDFVAALSPRRRARFRRVRGDSHLDELLLCERAIFDVAMCLRSQSWQTS